VLGVLVILAFAARSAYDGWRAYENARSSTEREIDNESRHWLNRPRGPFRRSICCCGGYGALVPDRRPQDDTGACR